MVSFGMYQESLYSKVTWLRQHEGWAQNLWDKGVAAGYQDATHMAVQNALGTYSSLVNEEAMEKLRAQEKANVPMGSVNLHYPDVTIFEVYKLAYDTGYYNATIEFDKANPMAAAQLAAINAAHKIDRDLEPDAFARWERKMALHVNGYDGPSMEAAAQLGLGVLSGVGPTAAMLKSTAAPKTGAASDMSPALAGVEGLVLGLLLGGAGATYFWSRQERPASDRGYTSADINRAYDHGRKVGEGDSYHKGFAVGWTNGALAVIDHPDCFKDAEERQNLADIRDGAIGPEGAAELQRYYQQRFDK